MVSRLLKPSYVEECHRVLEKYPQTFAAYSDIETINGRIQASEATGPIELRIGNVMKNLYNGYSYRALMRRQSRDWQHLRLRPNPPTDFCVDSTWILQQACLGELRRVPKPLYRKRSFERSTHHSWRQIPGDQLLAAWRVHCAQMKDIAASYIDDAAFIDALFEHRSNASNVREAPQYLKLLFRETELPQ